MYNKNVLLGVTGGIAAYKSAELVRRLREAGASVRVVMTSAAKEFITALTLQALSGHPVHDDLWDKDAEAAMGHIALARWADVIIIAPASADFLARLTQGQANDLLSTLCLATHAPVFVAPAMNQQMWSAPTTQENLARLKARGTQVLGPGVGEQACGETGPGRMLEPGDIVAQVKQSLRAGILEGKRLLITAGPTREYIDPVRFISNLSSGKMGHALAEAAVEAGAVVTLVSGPTVLHAPRHVQRFSIETTAEMLDIVMQHIQNQDIFVASAAVSDYRPAEKAEQKISKTAEEITLSLIRNPDILALVGQLENKPFTVGFAAQTEALVKNAREKLLAKRCDLIAANQVGVADQGFNSDNNALTVVWEHGEKTLPLMSKKQLAREFIQLISEHYYAKHPA